MSRGDYGPGRTYTAEQKAEAVGLAYSIGPKKAGEQLGIPPRTVAYWKRHGTGSSVVEAAISVVATNIAERLEAAHALALDTVIEGLRNPKTRLSDAARALEVLGTQLQLARGAATQNIETHAYGITGNLTDEEKDQARELLRALAMADLNPQETLALRQGLDGRTDRDALDRVMADPLHIDPADAVNAINAIEAEA